MIDRSACPGTRHGDYNAYNNYGCKCEDARRARGRYAKQRKLARMQGQVGRPGSVPVFRARRRVQALACIGWPAKRVHEEAFGYSYPSGTGGWLLEGTVTGERFAALDAAYERLCMTPGPSKRAKDTALAKGWAPPLAWEDIDDPDETPEPNVVQVQLSELEAKRQHNNRRWARNKLNRRRAQVAC